MAIPISDLDTMEAAEVAPDDKLLIDDASASESKTIEVGKLLGLPVVGWTASGESWSYSNWTVSTRKAEINVPSDATLKYSIGMVVRFTQSTGGIKHGTVIGVSATLLTVIMNSGDTLINEAISDTYYSTSANPFDLGIIVPERISDKIPRVLANVDATGVSNFTASWEGEYKYLKAIATFDVPSSTDVGMRFNGDNGSNYSHRGEVNYGTPVAASGQTRLIFATSASANGQLVVFEIINRKTRSKAVSYTGGGASGSSTAYTRSGAGSWGNTSDSIQSINLQNSSSVEFQDANLVIIGHN